MDPKDWEKMGVTKPDDAGSEIPSEAPEGTPIIKGGEVVGYSLPEKPKEVPTDEIGELFKKKATEDKTEEQKIISEAMGDAPKVETNESVIEEDSGFNIQLDDEEDIVITEEDIQDIPEKTILSIDPAADLSEDIIETDFNIQLDDEYEEESEDPDGLSPEDRQLLDMPVIDYGIDNPITNTFKIKGKPYEVKSSKKVKTYHSNADFISGFEKIQRKIRSKVKAPLINSGFIVNIKGGGLLELAEVYDIPEEGVTIDYTRRKHDCMIQSITGVSPRLDGGDIPKLLYWLDYDAMSWAFACATIDKITHIVSCPEQENKTFKIEGSPLDLLVTDDEFMTHYTKLTEITKKNQIESVVDHTNIFEDTQGNTFTLKHPNYIKGSNLLKEIKRAVSDPSLSDTMKDLISNPVINALLLYIDDLLVMDNIKASTIVQKLYVIKSLSGDDMDALSDIIDKMNEEVYKYKFAFSDIECPICGGKHTYDVPDVDGLVFRSRLLTNRMLEIQLKIESKNGES